MADEQDLYNKFGNYVGPDLDSSNHSSNNSSAASSRRGAPGDASDVFDNDRSRDGGGRTALVVRAANVDAAGTTPVATAIVIHEDKVLYPSAAEVYGDGVRTVVLDKDAMDQEDPIVSPVKLHTFSVMRDAAEEWDAYVADVLQPGRRKGGTHD
jgi:U5 small nuclear ribonucleoprotein component